MARVVHAMFPRARSVYFRPRRVRTGPSDRRRRPPPYPLSGQVRDSVHRPQGAPTSGDRRRVILQDQYRPAERSEGDCDCRSPGGSRSRFPHRSLLRRGAPHELEVAVMQLEVAVIYLQFAQIILHFNAHQDLPGDGGALPLPLLRSLRLPRAYGPLLVRRGVCGAASERHAGIFYSRWSRHIRSSWWERGRLFHVD